VAPPPVVDPTKTMRPPQKGGFAKKRSR